MKQLIFAGLLLSMASLGAVREVTIKSEKKDDGVHWMPEKVEVTAGEEVKFLIKHDLEGGFDFHGFFIPQLKIQKEVHRHKAEEITVKIPKDLKPGEYTIGCHLHPTHKPAILEVKAAAKQR